MQKRQRPRTYYRKEPPPKFLKIVAPTVCNLLKNPEATIKFFKDLDSTILIRRMWADIDFGGVNDLGNEVILYLLSRMDHYRERFIRAPIKGNFPADRKAKKVFDDSGFYDFVKTDVPIQDISTSDTLKIRNGFRVDESVAHDLREFVKAQLPGIAELKLKQVYRSVIECMANTNNHAYSTNENDSKWWLICKADKINNKVYLIFLDNGKGIPATMKTRVVETMTFTKDAEYVSAALEGTVLRSRTGKPERGKGLPSLNKQFKTGYISDLCIISRKAHLNLAKNTEVNLEHRFFGTLLTWGIH